MVEMDYRTDKEKAKDRIIEKTVRDVKQTMERIYLETKDLKEVERIQARLEYLLGGYNY
jgi:predicted RNA-binding protein with PIN domain